MEPREYEEMFKLEDTYWWFVNKRKLICGFLKKALNNKNSYILDIGCGTGANLKSFSKYGRVFGTDISPFALRYSSIRGCSNLVGASINSLPFKDEIFNVIILSDILYHRMVSESSALSNVYRILKIGGEVIITDSALEFLKGPHDMAVHGERRYYKKSLKQIINKAGFKVERLTYTNFLLFPVVCIIRLWRSFSKKNELTSDVRRINPVLNYLFLIAQASERFLLKFTNLPIGSSILCIARKPAQSQ